LNTITRLDSLSRSLVLSFSLSPFFLLLCLSIYLSLLLYFSSSIVSLSLFTSRLSPFSPSFLSHNHALSSLLPLLATTAHSQFPAESVSHIRALSPPPSNSQPFGCEGREKHCASEPATSPQPRNLARRVRERNRSGRKRKGDEGQRADGSGTKRNRRSSNARLITQAESKALELGRRVKTTMHESNFLSLPLQQYPPRPGPNQLPILSLPQRQSTSNPNHWSPHHTLFSHRYRETDLSILKPRGRGIWNFRVSLAGSR